MRIDLFRPRVSPEAAAAVAAVLESGWLGTGAKVREFEIAFAKQVDATDCVMVNNGTAAIHLALHSADLPAGAEVITSPLTYVATHHAILYAGYRPIFADVQPTTGNLDPASVAARITPQTRALLPIHYAGYPCDLDQLYRLAEEHSLAVIEDCAHATGASYRGAPIGSSPGLCCFSLNPTKNLTAGQGGAITTSRSGFGERLRALRNLGLSADSFTRQARSCGEDTPWRYAIREVGYPYAPSDLNAAIGLVQLPRLVADNQRRAEIASVYRSCLRGRSGIQLLEYADDRESSYCFYPILVERRDDLAGKLRRHGVGVGVHFPPNDLLADQYDQTPNAVDFSRRTLTLPLHVGLTDDDLEIVSGLVAAGW
ncbi:MAG: DegT/DnrJ/EryC1/StrS family aminotransferase [Chloroflexi bacterium]|nr:DegT/DnrJ/EryC1/StrS family aminotransferase [Chloroflexota bacterium]